ncbi:MAG: exo-alpha-sialidase [Promethearchaeota archaeon]
MLKIASDITIENLTKAVPGNLHHAHCSTIVAFPDGELVAAWYWALKEADINEEIYITRKIADTNYWHEPKPWGLKSRFMFDGNPVLWRAPDTGILHIFYNAGWGWSAVFIKHKTSTDRGMTWNSERNVYPLISRGVKNPPIIIAEGAYILPAYVEFKYLRAVFFISKNKGKSWKQSTKVDLRKDLIPEGYEDRKGRQVEQPTVIERADGSLLALCRNDGRPLKYMLKTESFDGGYTWTPAENYVLPNPAGGFHMIKLQSGNVAIIYNHAPAPDNDRKWRNPLSVALSEDDGETWKFRRNLLEWHPDDDDAGDSHYCTFEYPTMVQGPDGRIHAIWSFSHEINENENEFRVMDIQYTTFTEEWIKKGKFFENSWELK